MLYLYSLGSSAVLLLLILCSYYCLTSVCYWQRQRIIAHVSEPTRQRLESVLQRLLPPRYAPLNVFDWHSALNAGFTSSLFDIEANIQDGDPRAGLDEAGMEQIHRMMQTRGLVRLYRLTTDIRSSKAAAALRALAGAEYRSPHRYTPRLESNHTFVDYIISPDAAQE